MKTRIYIQGLLITTLFMLASCSKKNDPAKKVEITPNNLTSCPSGSSCRFLFTEKADLSTLATFKTGDYRLFWSTEEFSGGSRTVYIKAPLSGNSFELSKADILAGKVVFVPVCPACYSIPFKPVDGYVKGINVHPEKPTDQTQWLIEGKILLQSDVDEKFKDTIAVKQYFTPNFVID